MSKLIIDRTKWNRPGGLYNGSKPALLNQFGMCCLGFECIRLGLTEDQIKDKSMPASIFDLLEEKGAGDHLFLHGFDSTFSLDAAAINDNTNIAGKEREEQLVAHFKTVDIQLEFIN